jgi:hypothetical protein
MGGESGNRSRHDISLGGARDDGRNGKVTERVDTEAR